MIEENGHPRTAAFDNGGLVRPTVKSWRGVSDLLFREDNEYTFKFVMQQLEHRKPKNTKSKKRKGKKSNRQGSINIISQKQYGSETAIQIEDCHNSNGIESVQGELGTQNEISPTDQTVVTDMSLDLESPL